MLRVVKIMKEKNDNQINSQEQGSLREKIGQVADVVADSMGKIGKAAKSVGEKAPYVGLIAKGASVVGDAAKDTQYGMGESIVCSTLSLGAQAVVGGKFVAKGLAEGAVIGGLAAGGPIPNPYIKGAGAIVGGIGGAAAASALVAPVVKPIGEATKRVCHATFDWLYDRNRTQADTPKEQQKQAAQDHAVETKSRYDATNLHAQRYAYQQVMNNTRCFNLPYQPRNYSVNSLHLAWKLEQQAILEFRLRYGFVNPFIEGAIRRQVSVSSLSYLNFSGLSDFSISLMATNLISSYNAYNIASSVYSQWGSSGEIGGVATEVATINNLINSEAHASAEAFFLCFPEKNLFISDALFNRIQHEIHNAFFNHKTLPFFSLHFNQKGFLYPVIHPAFQNTLTGELIGLLDYWMKGFLNGGIFDEEFLKKWHETANCDDVFLRSKMIDLKKYCKEKLPSLGYLSLRELESRYGVKSGSSHSAYQQPFMTAFRIIAYQEKVEMQDNILLPHPSFKVEYSIELMPDYKQYVDSYLLEHGKYPPEYEKNLLCYELFAQEVKEKMPQLPFCKDFFNLLGVANSLCYYYTTLEKMGKRPVLRPLEEPHGFHFPKSLPPIPVRYFKTYPMAIQLKDVMNALNQTYGQLVMDKTFTALFSAKKVEKLSTELEQKIQTIVFAMIKEKLTPQLLPGETAEINEDEGEKIAQIVARNLLHQIRQLHGAIDKDVKKTAERLTKAEQVNLVKIDLPGRIHYVKEGIIKKQALIKARWDNEPQLAQTEIFAEIPSEAMVEGEDGELKSLQDIVRANFDDIKKTIKENINKELSEVQKKEIMELTAVIEGLEANKTAEIAKVPANLRALNQTVINSFIAGEDAKIKQIRDAISRINTNISALNTDVATLFSSEKATVIDKIKQEVQKLFGAEADKELEERIAQYERLEEVTTEAFCTASFKEATRILALVYANESERLDGHLIPLLHFTDTLLSHKKIAEQSMAKQYTHALTVFTGAELASKTGDNFQIIGGCGMDLPNLNAEPLPYGERFAQALSQAFKGKNQEKSRFNHAGQSYIAYQLPIRDFDYITENTNNLEGVAGHGITNIALQAIDSLNEDPVLVSKVRKEALETRVDDSHATFMHYSATALRPEYFAELIKIGEIESLRFADNFGNLPLHMAAQAGNVDAVALMLARAPELVDAANKRDLTPLMLAVQHGKQAVMEKLHQAGANFNHCLPNGLFPLYMAAQKNFTPLALWMLKQVPQLDVNKTLDSKMTTLHLAIQSGEAVLANELVKHGAHCDVPRKSDGFTALHCAAQQGEVDLITSMLAVNSSLSVNLALESKKTPLHLAAEAGQFETVKLLVGKGALVDALTLQSETPLMLAIQAGRVELAKWLAERVAIDLVNQQQQTASQLALQYAMPEVSDILVRRGENLHLNDKKGRSYLYFLVRNGEYQRVKQLLKKGENFDKRFDSNSLTAIAAQYGHFMIVYALQENGIPYKTTTSLKLLDYAVMANEIGFLRDKLNEDDDLVALTLKAIESGALQCLSYLLKQLSAKELQEINLLNVAIATNDEKICALLLKSCKDINLNQSLDAEGNGPLHIAIKNGAHRILPMLKESGCFFAKANVKKQTAYHLAVLQEDADLLKRLFKLSHPREWPRDLWSMNNPKPTTAIAKVLTKYEIRLPKNAKPGLTASSSTTDAEKKPSTTLLPNPLLSKNDRKVMKKFKQCLQRLQFDKALSLFKKEKILRELFKSPKGGSLLQHIFANIHDMASLQAEFEGSCLSLSHIDKPLEQLLTALRQAGINPALYKAKDNVLLAITRAVDDETACYRFDLLAKFFPESIAPLVVEEVSKEGSLMHIMTVKSYYALFEKMDVICRQAKISQYNGLQEAVKANQYELVKQLLRHYSVNSVNHKGQTPLMFAAASGNVMLINLLLEQGAKVDHVDLQGNGVLHYTLEKPSEAAALTLLPLMKKPNQANRFGLSPMMLAAAKESLPILRFLCESGQSIQGVDEQGRNALHYAAIKGKVKSIQYLVKQGFNLDQPESPEKPNKLARSLRRTPLHLAALHAQEEAVLLLLQLNADPKLEDKRGFSLSEYAVCSKNREMMDLVKLLPFYHSKERNTTLLHAAVSQNNIDVLSELILDDINLNALDKNGRSALHIASISGAGDALNWLLKGGDLVLDCVDQLDKAPIHYAAQFGHVQLIELLAKAGAKVDQLSDKKLSALDLACAEGHCGAVVALLKQGANFTRVNSERLTPAQTALLKGHFSIVNVLLKAGDKSTSLGAFSHLPREEQQQLSTAVEQYAKQYPRVKEGLVQHGFYKQALKNRQQVVAPNPSNANVLQ